MAQSSDTSAIEQLERLSKLHSDGALTDEEFAQLKTKLLTSQHALANHSAADANSNAGEPLASPTSEHAGTRFDQDITLAVVVGWAWSVFFAILGATMLLTGHASAGACAFVSALMVFPPLDSFVSSQWRVSFPAALRFPLAFVLIIATGWLLGITLENFAPPAAQSTDVQPAPTQETSTSADQPLNSTAAPEPPASPPTSEVQSGSTPVQQPPEAEQNTQTEAVDSLMEPRFGNTVISRGATTEWHLYFNNDHTFNGREIRSNFRVAGTWQIVSENLCLRFEPPMTGTPDPNCKPIAMHQIGDSWAVDDSMFTLVQGIQ